MKILKIFILLLLSYGAQAQYIKPNNSYGTISNRQSIDSTIFIPTGCGTPSLRGVDLHKAAIYGDSCNNILYFYSPKDSTWNEAGGVSRSTLDSLLSGYYTIGQVDSIITATKSLFNGGLTGQALVKNSNTDLDFSWTTPAGSTNSNTGSGYRLAVPFTNNIRTIFSVSPILLDSVSNTNALTFKFDTASFHSTAYNNATYGSLPQQNINTSNIASNTTAIGNKADKSTTLNINGSSQDLSTNRTWVIPVGDSVISFAKNATMDSIILVLKDGRRLAVKDSIGGGGSGWSLTGNAGTTAGTNFIGTTDAQDFYIKANNITNLIAKTNGHVLINTTTDQAGRDLVIGTGAGGSLYVGDISFINTGGNRSISFGAGGNASIVSSAGTWGTFAGTSLQWKGNINVDGVIGMKTAPTLAVPGYGANEIYFTGLANGYSGPSMSIIRNLDQTFGGNGTRFSSIMIYPGKNTTSGIFGNLITNFDGTNKRGNLLIGTMTADASAIVKTESTTQGVLILPRMTSAQASAISSPAQGLLLFVTDTNGTFTSIGWWGYDGTSWSKLNN